MTSGGKKASRQTRETRKGTTFIKTHGNWSGVTEIPGRTKKWIWKGRSGSGRKQSHEKRLNQVPRGPLLSPHTLQSLGIELLPDAQSQVSV